MECMVHLPTCTIKNQLNIRKYIPVPLILWVTVDSMSHLNSRQVTYQMIVPLASAQAGNCNQIHKENGWENPWVLGTPSIHLGIYWVPIPLLKGSNMEGLKS